MTDEQRILRAQTGDAAAADELVRTYTPFAYAIAADYYTATGDRDDVRQEALYGLCKAIRDYRPGFQMSCRNFAALCIRRHLIATVKTQNTLTARQLTFSVRELVDDEGTEQPAVDLLPAPNTDPVEILHRRGELAAICAALATLSELERASLSGRLNGEQMDETQARLAEEDTASDPSRWAVRTFRADGRPRPKVVENAITRAQAKIKRALDDGPLERAA